MSRDWVVWLCSFLLFACGAVWAAVPIRSDFFVVSNVHDLFEILGSLATVVAVCVAAANINSWKHQVNAAADLELARRLVACLHGYRTRMQNMWYWADFAVQMVEVDDEITASDMGFDEKKISPEIKETREQQMQLKELVLQSQSAWRVELESEAAEIFKFTDRCFFILNNSFIWMGAYDSNTKLGERMNGSINRHWSWFVKNNCRTPEQAYMFIDSLISNFEKKIEKKLMIQ
ncbi:hypothetical protein [Pseudomonas canadensis]|uniref:hypothetical protein n=1 Tax=Pseudomonas canadensis TaxID=915099 RepID=UPI001267AC4F|nr:hypothetical protein [Pseudomonas canadensis]